MELYGQSFPEAVQLLTGESGEGQTEATTAPPTAFHLPLHNRTADRTTRLMPLHVGKGRNISTAIADIIDYVENPQKTDFGKFIYGYECEIVNFRK